MSELEGDVKTSTSCAMGLTAVGGSVRTRQNGSVAQYATAETEVSTCWYSEGGGMCISFVVYCVIMAGFRTLLDSVVRQ